MVNENKEKEEPKTIEYPFISDDDLKKLVYLNNLMLQEILIKIREETDGNKAKS